jgi:hypothetical protein
MVVSIILELIMLAINTTTHTMSLPLITLHPTTVVSIILDITITPVIITMTAVHTTPIQMMGMVF